MNEAYETHPRSKPAAPSTEDVENHEAESAPRRRHEYKTGGRFGDHGYDLPEDPRRKSVVLATALSAMPGLGQVYLGYYEQGFINIIVVGSLISLLQGDLGDITPLVGLFLAFFWLHNVVDANRRAGIYNQTLAGLSPMEWPEHVKMPNTRGSLFGGVLLILLGGLFLSHTLLDYSLRWIEDVWPVALILMGIYLLFRFIQDRNEQQG